jgi:hypothetical protein
MGALLFLLAHLILRVEDGQFEREYSRLFTLVVLGGGLLLLLIAGALVAGGVKSMLKER